MCKGPVAGMNLTSLRSSKEARWLHQNGNDGMVTWQILEAAMVRLGFILNIPEGHYILEVGEFKIISSKDRDQKRGIYYRVPPSLMKDSKEGLACPGAWCMTHSTLPQPCQPIHRRGR